MQDAMRFDVNCYGDDGARCMARFWAMKITFFYRLWHLAGTARPFVFSDEGLARFTEPLDFVQLTHRVTSRPALAGYAKVREMRPRGDGIIAR